MLLVAPVEVEDHEIVPDQRGTARAVLVHHPEGLVVVFPEDLPGLRIDAGIAVGSKVKVDFSILDDGGGRGVAVEFVYPLGLLFPEDLDVLDDLARLGVDPEGPQAHLGEDGYGGQEQALPSSPW